MLTGSFFEIHSFTYPEGPGVPMEAHADIKLNPSHPIFAGHFPGNPVVPGVCQVQIIRELVERTVRRKLRMTSADNVKFLSMINPLEFPELRVDIQVKALSEGHCSAAASISRESTVFLRFRGDFETEE